MRIFEDEKINELFSNILKKKDFSEEDLKAINEVNIKASDLSQELSQGDVNKLLKIKNIGFYDIDFQNLKLLGNEKINSLKFSNCNLKECNMENIRTTSLVLEKCNLKDNWFKDYDALDEIEKLEIVGRKEFDSTKVYEDYPNFDEMSFFEKYDIEEDMKYQTDETIDLASLKNFKNLKKLQISSVKLNEDFVEALSNMDNLRGLSILDLNMNGNIIVPNCPSIKYFNTNCMQDFNSIKKLTNVKNLSISGDDNTTNKSVLEGFNKLRVLRITGIKGIEAHIASKNSLSTLELEKCGVKNLDSFYQYSNLRVLNLNSNELSSEQLENILKLKHAIGVTKLSFNNTDADRKAKKTTFFIKNPQIAEKYRKELRLSSQEEIDLSTLLRNETSLTIESIEELKALKESGILDVININQKEINIGSFENISKEDIDILAQNSKIIRINSFRGMNEELLEKFQNCKFAVDDDQLANGNKEEEELYYTKDDIQEIYEHIDLLASNIPEGADDLTKFLSIYTDMADYIDYDSSGSLKSEQYIEGNDRSTRSYKGVLIYGKAVCRGYSLALSGVLDYVGIEARIVNGIAYGDKNENHAWNQVKINGKTYNTDLTWDCTSYKSGNELQNCLRGDNVFLKNHTPTGEFQKVERCTEDFDRNVLKSTIESLKAKRREANYSKKSMENQEQKTYSKETKVNKFTEGDFGICAVTLERDTSSETLKDLKELVNKNIQHEIQKGRYNETQVR